jgi:phosphonate transport system ATP-binding protein
MLEIERLSKIYPGGTRALVDVTLRVEAGEIVTVLGRSGAGKSTLLRCVNGFVQATRGHVVVDGLTVDARDRTLRAIRRRAGMIFQEFNLLGRLTVLENVLAGRLAHRPTVPTLLRRFPRDDYDLALAALARVGLDARARQRADTLSGGERQRVAIARVLAQQPMVLLADEPVASLDPHIGAAVLDLIRTVAAEDGLAVLMSLHQVDFARRFSDRIIGLCRGAVVFRGPAAWLTEPEADRIYAGDGQPILAHA